MWAKGVRGGPRPTGRYIDLSDETLAWGSDNALYRKLSMVEHKYGRMLPTSCSHTLVRVDLRVWRSLYRLELRGGL